MNNELNAGTAADSSIKADTTSVRQTIAETHVVGSAIEVVWKDATENPPAESGRFWCNVLDVNDLGISYYQWNCAYSKEDNRWSSNAMSKNVTHWTELLPRPV